MKSAEGCRGIQKSFVWFIVPALLLLFNGGRENLCWAEESDLESVALKYILEDEAQNEGPVEAEVIAETPLEGEENEREAILAQNEPAPSNYEGSACKIIIEEVTESPSAPSEPEEITTGGS